MKAFEIFRKGKQTSASGQMIDFSEDVLKQAVDAYDPALHEAPIVVGHPKDNGPAYGWVKALAYSDGIITAEPIQVDAEFSEMVSAGRFKKRSASFYTPDSPANPKPGTYYLRHVGFLGAQPPAVKGLKDVNFSDSEEGIVEFAEVRPWMFSTLATALRNIREWVVSDKGVEAADKVMPNYLIDEFNSEAERMRTADQAAAVKSLSSFSEGDDEMSKELQDKLVAAEAQNAQLKADKEAAEKKAADFAEAEKTIKAREQAIARKEIGLELDQLVAAGKVLPTHKVGLTEFMAALPDTDVVIEFGEGDKAQKVSPRQYMRDYLSALPKLVEFNERSADEGANSGAELKGQELANKAVEYREAMKQKGFEISVTEAVAAVRDGKKA